MASRATAIVQVSLIVTASVALGFLLDLDADGVSNLEEVRMGTHGLRADSDSDGLLDGDERNIGSDPRDPDVDGDGVPDGHEKAAVCVFRPDCDLDGLGDAQETGGYDPLDPDSFETGLDDGVVYAFEQAGQPASTDADGDGIPDAWEGSTGLIDWGPFDPRPGQQDLLVEFVHVEGPRSEDYDLDFSPAYDEVQTFFAADDITMQWTQSNVRTATEVRPDFLTEETGGYYEEVIQQSDEWMDPYVTTVVLNPQQTQEDLAGDILGATFLRSMIVTLDYGAHTDVTFTEESAQGLALSGDGEVHLQPAIESHIIGARPEQIQQLGFASEGIVDLGIRSDGDVYMVTRNGDTDFTWEWRPDWFRTAPNITTQDGSYLQLQVEEWDVDQDALAGTIAHELGHTFGLCHAHEAECAMELAEAERTESAIGSTTMSYTADPGTLNFLGSEWGQVHEYIACPPQAPIRLLASGTTPDGFYHAKYEASFTEESQARECGESTPLVADLGPPSEGTSTGRAILWLGVYVALSGAAVGWVGWRLLRPVSPDGP